ncbi:MULTISPECIES: transcriptional regulator [Acinetobacter]|uniref:transcriptional regulator n=1 Tax=Acinetobacter TaxID=469 RepID=UPI0032B5A3C5
MSNRLNKTDDVESGDQFVLWKANCGDYRGLSQSDLLSFLQDNLSFPSNSLATQYAAPNATGFNVLISNSSESSHLILTPIASYATGSITLPQSNNLKDKQELLVNSTQAVTTLTIMGNGAVLNGAPTSLSVNGYFRLKYDKVMNTWYRVG